MQVRTISEGQIQGVLYIPPIGAAYPLLDHPLQIDSHVRVYRDWLKSWAIRLNVPFFEPAKVRAAIRARFPVQTP